MVLSNPIPGMRQPDSIVPAIFSDLKWCCRFADKGRDPNGRCGVTHVARGGVDEYELDQTEAAHVQTL